VSEAILIAQSKHPTLNGTCWR